MSLLIEAIFAGAGIVLLLYSVYRLGYQSCEIDQCLAAIEKRLRGGE